MSLIPFGSRLHGEVELITAVFFTMPRNGAHGFRILSNDGTVLAEGQVPKNHSGHRNPLHLLRDVLATIDFGGLGKDYITTAWDITQP